MVLHFKYGQFQMRGEAMEKNSLFEVTVRVGECRESPHASDPWSASLQGADALEHFAEVLKAYGMGVSLDYSSTGRQAKVRILHATKEQVRDARTRGAGRPRKKYALTLEQIESMSMDEAREALGGVSIRSYYRIKSRLKDEKASN